MTTVTISSPVKRAIYRAFDILYDSTIEKGSKKSENDGENIVTVRIGSFFSVAYDVYIPYHDDDCEFSGETGFADECDCENVRTYTASLHYKRTELSAYEFMQQDAKSKLFDWINSIADSYQVCNCGCELVKRDGLCTMCYILSYERSEEEGGACCVCLENNGRWVKLNCNHIMHKTCYRNLVKSECPLCRHPHHLCKVIDDPYLV